LSNTAIIGIETEFWHDGEKFTSADVRCTWDLLTRRAAERLRLNPRKPWWDNVAEIVKNAPAEGTLVLKRPAPKHGKFPGMAGGR
jgi:peptide/nickel transport system substrate-binding protein